MSREAMRQALDALEKGETKLRWAAISALKQALAEPEQPVGINGLTEAETDASASVMGLVGKPEQEPVAWMKVENFIDAEGLWDERVMFNHDGDGKPLYTAPTTRKPLTDDELEPLLDAVPFYDIGNKDLINFARAIERAHGIGEQHE